MTHDGPNNVDLSYNVLNLTEKVSRDESILAKYSYLSDGTKLSATDSGGNGFVYLGSLVYRMQEGALSLESASFSGGRFIATAAGVEPFYHLTDHLGSVRVVSDARGNVFERNDYFPYGLRWDDPGSLLSDNRHRYNGKEEQTFVGVPYTDYGARMRDPKYRPNDWNGVDPLTEKTPGVSPFMFCNGNPVRNIDSNGAEWAYYCADGGTDAKWHWVDGLEYRTGVKDSEGKEIVLPAYNTVVVFDGSFDEKLGTGDSMYGEGAILADVTVYGMQGKEDIQSFKGYTMSSDPNKYGVVANGMYTVNRLSENERLGPYNSDLTVNKRGRVNALDNYNPAYPDRNPGYLTGVFIHRANNDGWAGARYDSKKRRFVAVSQGCLLISPNHWPDFHRSVEHTNQFILQINRK